MIFPMKHKYKHTYIESLIKFVYKIIYNNYYYFLRKMMLFQHNAY